MRFGMGLEAAFLPDEAEQQSRINVYFVPVIKFGIAAFIQQEGQAGADLRAQPFGQRQLHGGIAFHARIGQQRARFRLGQSLLQIKQFHLAKPVLTCLAQCLGAAQSGVGFENHVRFGIGALPGDKRATGNMLHGQQGVEIGTAGGCRFEMGFGAGNFAGLAQAACRPE